MNEIAPTPRSRIALWLDATAVYREPRVIAILLLGFSSGLPLLLTASTLSIWLTEVGVDLTTIGLFAIVATPYSLKFLWSPIIDRVRLPILDRLLGRRRSWLITTQVLLMATLIALGASRPGVDAGWTALLAFFVAFASASQDIVVDAFRIESLDERQFGAGAAMYVFGYRVALLVAGAGALYAASYTSWLVTYALMAAMILVGVVTVLLSTEPERHIDQATADLEARGHQALRRLTRLPGWLADAGAWFYVAVVCPFAEFLTRAGQMAVPILLFIMLYKFGDTLAGTMTNPFLVKIGFTKEEIAQVAKIFGFTATLAGLGLGGLLINGLGVLRSLWICGILQMFSNLMFAIQAMAGAHLGVLAVTIGVENLAAGMGTAAFVAYMSSLCNVSYTATQYALLTSFMAVARTWLASPAGWLVDHIDWSGGAAALGLALSAELGSRIDWFGFFLLTTVAAIPGLVLLLWLSVRMSGQTQQGAGAANAAE